MHKRLLLPFTPSPDAATPSELATIAVAAIPIGLAAVLCGSGPHSRRSVGRAVPLIAALGLVALEMIADSHLFAHDRWDGAACRARRVDRRVRGRGLCGQGTDCRRRLARVAHSRRGRRCRSRIAFVFEWWPFQFTADAPRALYEAIVVVAGAVPVAGERVRCCFPAPSSRRPPGRSSRPRLDPRFVRLQTMLVVGLTGAVFVICEGGRLLLVGGRPTLMSVVSNCRRWCSACTSGRS